MEGYAILDILKLTKDIYLYKDVQYQTIHISQLQDGMFINVRTIGRFRLENEAYLVTSTWSGVNTKPFKDSTVNTLKYKLLVYLYKRAYCISNLKMGICIIKKK